MKKAIKLIGWMVVGGFTAIGIFFVASVILRQPSDTGSATAIVDRRGEQPAAALTPIPAAPPVPIRSPSAQGQPESQPDVNTGSEPETLQVAVSAIDLVQNPFKYEHKTVTLKPVVQISAVEAMKIFGTGTWLSVYVGLRFNRMVTENVGLYDVAGLTYAGFPSGQLVGQIAVAGSSDQLDIRKEWQIEPEGTGEGTNAFGGGLSIPVVRFWRYVEQASNDQR